jgi:hypothetical protein
MSHVTALPALAPPSALEETATEATQFALTALQRVPHLLARADALDAAVGVAAVLMVGKWAWASRVWWQGVHHLA